MERVIKFRVWDGTDFMSSPFDLLDLQNRKVQFSAPCPVMQFTGLLDKNGKEIYEGDLVHWKDGSENPNHWRTGEVFYAPNRACYHVRITKCGALQAGHVFENNFTGWNEKNELQVLGNIYQNPELLKAA